MNLKKLVYKEGKHYTLVATRPIRNVTTWQCIAKSAHTLNLDIPASLNQRMQELIELCWLVGGSQLSCIYRLLHVSTWQAGKVPGKF